MSDRLEALRAMLEEDPDDAFTRYAVALELKSLGRLDEASAELQRVLDADPDYVATYYQYARVLQARGRVPDAVAIARRGVDVAARQGDAHTQGELEELVAELEA